MVVGFISASGSEYSFHLLDEHFQKAGHLRWLDLLTRTPNICTERLQGAAKVAIRIATLLGLKSTSKNCRLDPAESKGKLGVVFLQTSSSHRTWSRGASNNCVCQSQHGDPIASCAPQEMANPAATPLVPGYPLIIIATQLAYELVTAKHVLQAD